MLPDVVRTIAALRVVPVVTIKNPNDALPLAEALVAGALPCIEVTLRTPAAAEAIREIAKGSDILLGAGTVLTEDQVALAVAAGASFIVTPGFSPAVVRRCQAIGITVFPGVATPTEIQMCLDAGIETVKFFPAESLGGVATLNAISAPYPMVRFIPTGGITPDKLGGYLAHPSVMAVGGSWIATSERIAARAFDEITRLAAQAAAVASSTV